MTTNEIVTAILSSKHRGNYPSQNHQGKRIVGWIIDEDVAGLSEGLAAIEEIEKLARAALTSQDRSGS